MKLWEKGIALDKRIEAFTVGNDYRLDRALVKYDCRASIAHARMLCRIGILTKGELRKMIAELESIRALDAKGKFTIAPEQEDCHTAIENHLTKKLGQLGKKIHTARSRNDQVLAALRLYYKDEIDAVTAQAGGLIAALETFEKKHGNVVLPGYTHMRKAMPSSFGIWAQAFEDSLKDTLILINAVRGLIDQSPLGSGAGYGVPLNVNREYTSQLCGFGCVQKNSLYVQNSRGKFEWLILHVLSQVMLDINKMASDLMLFSMDEVGYVALPGELCTGSSMMPHKKNPDVLELLRAQYHVVLSLEFQTASLVGNLISGYHRDLQLLKEPVMKAFHTVRECLAITHLVIMKLQVHEENCKRAMTDELYATEKAYRLVKKGVPFRDAYRKTKRRTKAKEGGKQQAAL